jgi:hypothetical protein
MAPCRPGGWRPAGPRRYTLVSDRRGEDWVMHLFKEMGVKDLDAVAAKIPVIDYGPYFRGEPGALEKLGADLRADRLLLHL